MSLFKKAKRSFRGRKESSSDEEESEEEADVNSVVTEMKVMQKLRKRQHGVNIEDLAVGQVQAKQEKEKTDPLKLATGGYVDIKTLRKEIASVEDIEQIGTSFAAETNRRDEDADMLKYVETELAKRKGIDNSPEEEGKDKKDKHATDFLYELPDHIKEMTSKGKKSEDMLSNQMLSGIPEVDLGIDAKIRNIEATEEAKQKLIREKMARRNAAVSNFVPTNMAVNFVQHNRFNIDDHNKHHTKKEPPPPKPEPLRVGDADRPNTLQDSRPRKTQPGEKATDDFHFERFKKQLRKY